MTDCADCTVPISNYDQCRNCSTHRMMNTPCDICGNTGGVKPFTMATAKGPFRVLACERCRERHT